MAVWPNGSKTIPRVTAEFGPYDPFGTGTSMHNGIDLVDFDIVRAAVAGDIIYADYNGSAGNEVRIRAADGVVYRYLHNRAFIRTGGSVAEGEAIAYQGATGAATGKHCHFEIWSNGQRGSAVNPRVFMAQLFSQGAAVIDNGQRTAGPEGVKRRSEPTSKSTNKGDGLSAGEVGNFTGWIHGESVDGNDVWYQGTSGDWFWSGGFVEGANGTGLKDLNPTSLAGNQRRAGTDGVRRRKGSPSTSAAEGEMLAPGTVGNFDGWINGQEVSGNKIWFRGTSGDWFWSGGFEDKGTHDLNDLNPKTPAVGANQRTAGPDGVRRRKTPSSKAPETGTLLAAGVVGTFDAWATGESVEGNTLWYRGASSGDWFWSGGFVEAPSKTGLTEVKVSTTPEPEQPKPKPEEPKATGNRTVGNASANGRSGPGRTYTITTSLAAGATAEFDAYVEGEAVEGIKIWFRRKGTATWFWAGGFTSQSVEGLVKTTFEGPTGPKELPKFFPLAKTRYEVEMGGVRDATTHKLTANRPAGGDKIRRIWIHHCAATSDQVNYFLGWNERNSCPSLYVRTGGEAIEFVPPSQRPWSTGAADADALAIETQNTSGEPTWGISPASHETIAQYVAWVAQQKSIDGVPVEFVPSALTVKGHREAPGASTACPGPSMNIPWIIERALQIMGEDSGTPEQPGDNAELQKVKAELAATQKQLQAAKSAWSEYNTALAQVEDPYQKVDALLG